MQNSILCGERKWGIEIASAWQPVPKLKSRQHQEMRTYSIKNSSLSLLCQPLDILSGQSGYSRCSKYILLYRSMRYTAQGGR